MTEVGERRVLFFASPRCPLGNLHPCTVRWDAWGDFGSAQAALDAAGGGVEVLEEVLRLKFSQDAGLRAVLLETHPCDLVFAVSWDRVLGAGLSPRMARCVPDRCWPGENRLGRALVRVRDALLEKHDSPSPTAASPPPAEAPLAWPTPRSPGTGAS